MEVTSSTKGQKICLQKPKVKTILVCFYNSKGIIRHEFVPEGQTVTGSFYLSVLEHLWKKFRRVRPEYSAPGSWFLLHDNVPVHLFTTMHRFTSSQQCTASPLHENAPVHLFTTMHRFTPSRQCTGSPLHDNAPVHQAVAV